MIGALNIEGKPIHKAGISDVPGSYYVGVEGQRSFAYATLRVVAQDEQYVVKKYCIIRDIKSFSLEKNIVNCQQFAEYNSTVYMWYKLFQIKGIRNVAITL